MKIRFLKLWLTAAIAIPLLVTATAAQSVPASLASLPDADVLAAGLAVLVAIGLSAASLVISLFGPTQPMVAHFAWVLAISFVATGTMLLAVAHCARRAPV